MHGGTFQSNSSTKKQSVPAHTGPEGDASWSVLISPHSADLCSGKAGASGVSAPCATHPPKDGLWVKFSWDHFLPAAPASGPQSEERRCSASDPFDVLIFIRCHASISGPQALQKQFQSHKNDPNLVEISVNSGVMNIANLDHHFFQQNWIKEVPRPYY